MFLTLKFVGTEKLKTAVGLLVSQTFLVALKQLEDVIDDNGLKIDLLLVVKIFGLELNLRSAANSTTRQGNKRTRRYLPGTCQPWRLL